ncbi:MAG: 16S rRNA (adenine(1518)-N(6)/adenine(1519)-N(6))-dimethyltransferase RsmA [Lachnospiraceae bacterium]|nr:16S rRNA (adenine(1518)-N(6)/adenine(1519)-N(6))-dimethyltransferase RsmA [Lachnospiraceae bacterium]
MPDISNPKNTRDIISKHNFNIRKDYGQNFLVDGNILQKIIDSAEVTKDDLVIEIGPGIGSMTQYLCEAAGNVLAIEIDKALIPILSETLSSYDNVEIINNDVLKIDLDEMIEERRGERHVKVVANLPYYITTPVIMGLLEKTHNIESITVMIQKEVADRMQVGPGTKDYGALSLAVQYYSNPTVVANVPPTCFIPRPKVGSAVIRLDIYREPPVTVKDPALMFALIRAAFNQRRKTLTNALTNAQLRPALTKEALGNILTDMGLPDTIRGEALTLEQYAQLTDIISGKQ